MRETVLLERGRTGFGACVWRCAGLCLGCGGRQGCPGPRDAGMAGFQGWCFQGLPKHAHGWFGGLPGAAVRVVMGEGGVGRARFLLHMVCQSCPLLLRRARQSKLPLLSPSSLVSPRSSCAIGCPGARPLNTCIRRAFPSIAYYVSHAPLCVFIGVCVCYHTSALLLRHIGDAGEGCGRATKHVSRQGGDMPHT